ncbi:hypothetical protein G9A89_009099 [Geosiphon pyriformis]|nr:hypothetical protein G9A89_009099 [Geosiphon pyriformis]
MTALGNNEVDEIIKNPIYIPPKSNYKYDNRLNYYSWIPWERLSNIKEIARGGFGIIYKAIWYRIVMVFAAHGDMRKYFSTYFHSVSWKDKLHMVGRIVAGLDSIHYFGMVHRSLHSGNILNLSYDDWVIGDLGLCQPVKNEATTTEKKKIYGVYPYIPPEFCPMLLWELATGKPPFHDRSHDHFLVMDIYRIVMVFAAHGDMRKYFSTYFHSVSWKDKLHMVGRIVAGLDSIHYFGMVHRSLHSGNILNLSYDDWVIGDLGLCQPVKNEATTTEKKKIYGVYPYIPPEFCPMLLWELATGKPPFHDRSHDHFLVMDISILETSDYVNHEAQQQRKKIYMEFIHTFPPEVLRGEKFTTADLRLPENRPTAEVKQKLRTLGDI